MFPLLVLLSKHFYDPLSSPRQEKDQALENAKFVRYFESCRKSNFQTMQTRFIEETRRMVYDIVSIVRDRNLDILFINGGMLRMPF